MAIPTNKTRLFLSLLLTANLAGCSAMASPEGGGSPNYDEVKTMVQDILQTEDGKKALQQTLKDETVKKELLMDGEEIKTAVQTTLLSDKGQQGFKKIMEDPKFSARLAKSMQKENKKLMKDLMKDPEYQKMLIDTLKDPEFEKNLLDLMKTSTYRDQMMTVIKDAMQSPLFKDELLKLITKATEEAMKPEAQKKAGGGAGEGGAGGGQSGAQGGGGGG